MINNALSLHELNHIIGEVLQENTERNYWIIAEINELKTNRSGHCYLELIEKDEESDRLVARSRATIWAPQFRMIKPYFETTTGQPLTEGLSIMVKVRIEFHELYGLSLNITDIEPTYTVGELALQKQKIIDRLTREGVIDMNKELPVPVPCNKIAVISSATAAGYGDFCDQLLQNAYGYRFYIRLFPAVMQGNEAEASIVAALERIYDYEDFFDAVVIIRGGGSQADLNCFNGYWIAYHISQFPIPVFTGIGHEQDDTVADLVAHTRLKTPTAVAAFLIDGMAYLDEELQITSDRLKEAALQIVESKQSMLKETAGRIRYSTTESVISASRILYRATHQLNLRSREKVSWNQNRLAAYSDKLKYSTRITFRNRHHKLLLNRQQIISLAKSSLNKLNHRLESGSEKISYLDPRLILSRGYSITLSEGKPLKDTSVLKPGDQVETRLFRGKFSSTVNKK